MNFLSALIGVSILGAASITGVFVAGTSENGGSNGRGTSAVTADVEAERAIDADVTVRGSEDASLGASLDGHSEVASDEDASVKTEPGIDVEAKVNADANVKADLGAESAITVAADAGISAGASFSATGEAGTMEDSDADEPAGSTQILAQTGLNADGSVESGRSGLSLDMLAGVDVNSKGGIAP